MKKKLEKQIKFCQDLVNVFSIYASCLDDYFEIENNKKEHKDLYNYYRQLITNVNNLKNGYDIK